MINNLLKQIMIQTQKPLLKEKKQIKQKSRNDHDKFEYPADSYLVPTPLVEFIFVFRRHIRAISLTEFPYRIIIYAK